jgi:hypothetical protein
VALVADPAEVAAPAAQDLAAEHLEAADLEAGAADPEVVDPAAQGADPVAEDPAAEDPAAEGAAPVAAEAAEDLEAEGAAPVAAAVAEAEAVAVVDVDFSGGMLSPTRRYFDAPVRLTLPARRRCYVHFMVREWADRRLLQETKG